MRAPIGARHTLRLAIAVLVTVAAYVGAWGMLVFAGGGPSSPLLRLAYPAFLVVAACALAARAWRWAAHARVVPPRPPAVDDAPRPHVSLADPDRPPPRRW
ncbi:hypothetical protein [Cellulomonas sp.]|uniref:hypothetical protein n=1 Tax=Cellulomonas sp. TaxID=40001 RepID=UPI002589A84F|nr:hypothetical protein [Cellulomonas sp.]MCR6690122.1 hypothetical protein [Cellulomonas sp.]